MVQLSSLSREAMTSRKIKAIKNINKIIQEKFSLTSHITDVYYEIANKPIKISKSILDDFRKLW